MKKCANEVNNVLTCNLKTSETEHPATNETVASRADKVSEVEFISTVKPTLFNNETEWLVSLNVARRFETPKQAHTRNACTSCWGKMLEVNPLTKCYTHMLHFVFIYTENEEEGEHAVFNPA